MSPESPLPMITEEPDICVCNGIGTGTLIQCTSCHIWYHCSCVGVAEEDAKYMDGYICEFCSFDVPENDQEEEDYIFEQDVSTKRKRGRSEYHRSGSIGPFDIYNGAVEELSEKNVVRAICKIEQKLLLEDNSPSIHDSVVAKNPIEQSNDDNFETVISSYAEMKVLRTDLQRKGLLHHLVKVKDMIAVKESTDENDRSDLNDEMKECVEKFSQYDPPPLSIPINADIRTFNWDALGKRQFEMVGRYYDVIMMDPPWQLSSANPTRGVAIGYEQLGDDLIQEIPLKKIQSDGYLFLWVINAKYRVALDMLECWGYTFVDEIAWVKCNRSRRMAKSHGFYLQHSKETCFVAKRGNPPPLTNFAKESDVIYSERLGQSQKPIDIYEMIERLVPNGYYLEVFGRRNNLRNNWVTVGNELYYCLLYWNLASDGIE